MPHLSDEGPVLLMSVVMAEPTCTGEVRRSVLLFVAEGIL